jgi:hypothetical protein
MAFREPPALAGNAIRLADDKGGKLGPSLAALPAVHFLKGGAELADLKALEGNPEPLEDLSIADGQARLRPEDEERFKFIHWEKRHAGRA